LIVLTGNNVDRRSFLITLTAKGLQQREATIELALELRRQAIAGLDEKECALLLMAPSPSPQPSPARGEGGFWPAARNYRQRCCTRRNSRRTCKTVCLALCNCRWTAPTPWMSISELLTDITLFAIFLSGAAMVREKERGTVEQLLVSPLTPFQIVFPKMLAMTAVILAGTALSLFLILKCVFQVPMHGSLLLFFAVTTLYVFTTAGLGMFIATLARNMAQVGMLTALVFLPMIFLSGAWTPPEAMTYWMRGLMYISPLHYFLDASFGILLKGAGISMLWDSVLFIALIGSINFTLGMWRFRRQFQ